MENIIFANSNQKYVGKNTLIGKNQIAIEFVGGIPKEIDTLTIRVQSEDGVEYLKLEGFQTEYRRVDACLILSNDGSVFPGDVMEERDPVLALVEAKTQKRNEMGAYCKAAITAGCKVMVGEETQHFRMTEEDQLNLIGKQIQLMAGATQFEYHEGDNPCRYYSAEEMQQIIATTMAFKTYHTTYCNALNMWIKARKAWRKWIPSPMDVKSRKPTRRMCFETFRKRWRFYQMKRIGKWLFLFCTGGLLYSLLELGFRGRTHWSMFVVGGICFVFVGGINEWFPWEWPLLWQMLLAAAGITAVELISGVLLNIHLGLQIWDYSSLPWNLMGQICLPYTILWFFLSGPAIVLDDLLRYWFFGEEKPRYFFIRRRGCTGK